jgi:hypothetical protein
MVLVSSRVSAAVSSSLRSSCMTYR